MALYPEGVLALLVLVIAVILWMGHRRKPVPRTALENAQVRDFLDNAMDLMQKVWIDGRFAYVNRAWKKVLGYSDEDLAALRLSDIIHPDCGDHCRQVLKSLTEGETVPQTEVVFRTKSGEPVVLEGNIKCRFENGLPVSTEAVLRVIDERKRMERELQEREERFRQLAEHIHEVFWIYDFKSGKFPYLNPAYSALTGREPGPLLEEAGLFFDLFFPEDVPFIKELIAKLRKGQTVNCEHRLRHLDGQTKWVRLICVPLIDPEGKVYRFVGVSDDVTERKQHQQKLEELIRQKDNILRITAHDVGNLLQGIMGMAELIESKDRDYLNTLKSCVEEVQQIIGGLLKAEEIESGNLGLEKKWVNLGEFLLDRRLYFKNLAGKKEQILDFNLALKGDAFVDGIRIAEAMDNYISNAVKYSPSHSRIEVSLKSLGDRIRFSVKDEGPGLTDQDMDRVFGKFQRLSALPTAGESSSGLGLSIVKSLIEMHGGTVGVFNNEARGCTFWFEIPRE